MRRAPWASYYWSVTVNNTCYWWECRQHHCQSSSDFQTAKMLRIIALTFVLLFLFQGNQMAVQPLSIISILHYFTANILVRAEDPQAEPEAEPEAEPADCKGDK